MPTKEYKIDRVLENILKDEDISSDNKKTIKKFLRFLRVNEYSKARQQKYLYTLAAIGRRLKINFNIVEKKDIEEIIEDYQKRDLSYETILSYKSIIKRFWLWLNGDEEYPVCVRWVKTTKKKSKIKLPKKLLTEEDIKALIGHAKNPRDRALIALLWETGARIGELLDLKIENLEDYTHGMRVHLIATEKGVRKLPLIESVPYINAWLNAHPDRRNSAYLFVNVGTTNNGKQSGYRTLSKALKNIADDADINKPVNPHHFRHSRATYLANRFTEAQMKEWFGWGQDSSMAARYVHLSGRDIDGSYERLHGIETESNSDRSKLTPISCPRCGASVSPDSEFCYKCGLALSIEAYDKAQDYGEKLSNDLPSLLNDEVKSYLPVAKALLQLIYENDEVKSQFDKLRQS